MGLLNSVWFLLIMMVVAMILVVTLVQKKQAIATKLALIIGIFLVLTVGFVYISSDAKIHGVGDVFNFIKTYFSWLGSAFHNLRTVTANVVNLDWAANNDTTTTTDPYDW